MRIAAAVSAISLAVLSSTAQAFVGPSSRIQPTRSTLLRETEGESSNAEPSEVEAVVAAAAQSEVPSSVTALREVVANADGGASTSTPTRRISQDRIEKASKERAYPLFLAEKTASFLIDPFTSPAKTLPSPFNPTPKEQVVVLGTGWGAAAFLKNIDTDKYDVTVISPRNYFVFTPMLAGASVGSVDFKSITEPIREVWSGLLVVIIVLYVWVYLSFLLEE